MKATNLTKKKTGFTLVELLVVIAIVAILAALSTIGYNKVKISAAKTKAIGNMRSIGALVGVWQADNNATEPFYVSNGRGDYSQEKAGRNNKWVHGNPGIALFDEVNPEAGLMEDPSIFFSPLTTIEAPQASEYRPSQASAENVWGTYVWHYPCLNPEDMSPRQTASIGMGDRPTNFSKGIGQLAMVEDYAHAPPRYKKTYYHGLMIDGSVATIGTTDAERDFYVFGGTD